MLRPLVASPYSREKIPITPVAENAGLLYCIGDGPYYSTNYKHSCLIAFPNYARTFKSVLNDLLNGWICLPSTGFVTVSKVSRSVIV
jgi:hypothetical protein